MTFREKLQKEHPEYVGKGYRGRYLLCPYNCGYESVQYCTKTIIGCKDCWDREIPVTEETEGKQEDDRTKTVNEIMLDCAKTIALACSRREGCKGCVFYKDSASECSLESDGSPETWMVPLSTIVRVTDPAE